MRPPCRWNAPSRKQVLLTITFVFTALMRMATFWSIRFNFKARPEIRVPLLPGSEDVVVDLQEVFCRCYDAGHYPRRVDYDGTPVPPLTDKQSQWRATIQTSV